jgi:hypothetical protein
MHEGYKSFHPPRRLIRFKRGIRQRNATHICSTNHYDCDEPGIGLNIGYHPLIYGEKTINGMQCPVIDWPQFPWDMDGLYYPTIDGGMDVVRITRREIEIPKLSIPEHVSAGVAGQKGRDGIPLALYLRNCARLFKVVAVSQFSINRRD